jgi:hypothetical protein
MRLDQLSQFEAAVRTIGRQHGLLWLFVAVLASRGGGAWVHWQEIGKLEDLPVS